MAYTKPSTETHVRGTPGKVTEMYFEMKTGLETGLLKKTPKTKSRFI